MSKSKKKQVLVKVKEPFFIIKKDKGLDLTIMVCKFALPWRAITNVPLCDIVMAKIEKVKKCYPEAKIEFNFSIENPAFIFNIVGITKRSSSDEADVKIGKSVARAKALAKACTISKAIIKAAMNGLEEELKRSYIMFDDWYNKEKKIIRGV